MNERSNLQGKIRYLNGDKFEGKVDISSGTIKRIDGKYFFKNGDIAQGKFDDEGSGIIKGFF